MIACNALMLVQLRSQRGYSIARLSQRAACSESQLMRAEAGAELSPELVQRLAEALSEPDQPLFPEDLTCFPERVARAYIDGFYQTPQQVVDRIRPFLDENVVFRIHGDPAKIPFAGEYHGIEDVERMHRIFFSVLEIPAGHDYRPCFRFASQGLNALISGESWIHPIGRPLTQPMPVSILMRFRRGKLVEFDDSFDTQRGASLFEQLKS